MSELRLVEIGRVHGPLTDAAQAPRQGDEGAPDCEIHIAEAYAAGLADLAPGQRLVVLTWLHLADRDTLVTHPRNDLTRPATGVFTTRSPARPNPIGLHTVTLLGAAGTRLRVRNLEALDGTPVLDIKPVLAEVSGR